MPDILRLKTTDWELNIWCRDISRRSQLLKKTLSMRKKAPENSAIRFSSPVCIESVDSEISDAYFYQLVSNRKELCTSVPLFFENLLYEFEFVFTVPVETEGKFQPCIRHKLSSINNAFHFSIRHGIPVLRGSINTGNDIGWLRLPLRHIRGNKVADISLSFEVLPVKMDLSGDLAGMYRIIDSEYPLWRFALAEKTEQDAGRSRQSARSFPLLWLAQFEALRDELDRGIRLIMSAPHSRLLPEMKPVKADRLKGRLPVRQTEKIREDITAGINSRHYPVKKKKLSIDTPENRFIKMVLNSAYTKLSHFRKIAEHYNNSPDKQRLSPAFFDQLAGWQQPLEKYRNHRLFREIGDFNGLSQESMVLQQKSGYSAVYRVWQQLKLYLDVLDNQAAVSMKSVAELYEVWCFLEIRRILTEDLKFNEKLRSRAQLIRRGFELETVDGFRGAFEFSRSDGIYIRLAHEPRFHEKSKPVRTWLNTQQPDIVLKARFPKGDTLVWLFDAKYRIEETTDSAPCDKVPDDAINQMHRYRDALIYQDHQKHENQKTRPVFGAFALYPGFMMQREDNTDQNPYAEAIREIGIGAFPLLPDPEGKNGNVWLRQFLLERFGRPADIYQAASAERYYLEEAARIPYHGMQQFRYRELTIVMPLMSKDEANEDYVGGFENGSARWYHISETIFSGKYGNHILRELQYCAIATVAEGSARRVVKWLWPVKSVQLTTGKELTVEQAGSIKVPENRYWLLELGTALRLEKEVSEINLHNLEVMKLTTVSTLSSVRSFSEIEDIYKEFIQLTA